MSRLKQHHGGWHRTPIALRPSTADHSGLKILDEVDPRSELPPVFDQGQLGSCTANATAGAFQYDAILDGNDPGPLSRLWCYYMERKIEGNLGKGDTGAIGSDAFIVASTSGICAESDWPYDIATFQGPIPEKANADERHYVLDKPYKTVTQTENALKAVLSNKQTVAFGFTVYESFESDEVAKTGIVPMPGKGEQELGGHEVLLVGYLKDEPRYGLVRNSWGTGWGLKGYMLFPWAYLTDKNLSGDHTTVVRSIS